MDKQKSIAFAMEAKVLGIGREFISQYPVLATMCISGIGVLFKTPVEAVNHFSVQSGFSLTQTK